MLTIDGAGRPLPVKNCATTSIGFCVADRPMRVGLFLPLNPKERLSGAPEHPLNAKEGLSGALANQIETLQRDRKVRSAFIVGYGMNLVNDDGFDVAQNLAAAIGGQQDIERLRRGYQDVWRAAQHLAPLFRQRVAGADGSTNLAHQHAALGGQSCDLAQRAIEVLLDIVAQRLQRRDVQNFSAVVQSAVECFAHQAINTNKEGRQRFARSGGRGDKRGASRQNFRPALLLRLSRRTELRAKPVRHERMRPREADRERAREASEDSSRVSLFFRWEK